MKAFCFLLLTCSCFAQESFTLNNVAFVGAASPNASAPSCADISQTTLSGFSYSASPFFGTAYNGRVYYAIPFWASNTVSICGVSLVMYRGDPTAGSFYVSIYSDSAGKPGTMLGGESAETQTTVLTTSPTTNKFVFSSPASVTANNTNWVVFRTVAMDNKTLYTWNLAVPVACITNKFSADGSTWSDSAVVHDVFGKFWK